MLKALLCVALLICVVRLQGLCMPYSAAAYSTASRPSATHPAAAAAFEFRSQDSAQKITLSTHLKVLTHWRRELQSNYWPKRTLEAVTTLDASRSPTATCRLIACFILSLPGIFLIPSLPHPRLRELDALSYD